MSQLKALSLGAAYGCVLLVLCFAAAGFGHGTYILTALFAAPLTLAGILIALLSMPPMWACIAVLATSQRSWKRAGAVILVCHYLVALLGWCCLLEPDLADWSRVATLFPDQWPIFALGGAVYVSGQVWLWRRILEEPAVPALRVELKTTGGEER